MLNREPIETFVLGPEQLRFGLRLSDDNPVNGAGLRSCVGFVGAKTGLVGSDTIDTFGDDQWSSVVPNAKGVMFGSQFFSGLCDEYQGRMVIWGRCPFEGNGTDCLWWTPVGGGGVVPQGGDWTRPILPDGVDADVYLQNDAGAIILPDVGDVCRVRKLGDMVVVYGYSGIAFLRGYDDEFGSGLGVVKIEKTRVLTADGDVNGHMFVKSDGGTIFSMSPSGEMKEVGYDYLGIRYVAYEPHYRRYVLTTASASTCYSYILNEYGAFQYPGILITGVSSVVPYVSPNFKISGATLKTEYYDFGVDETKTLTSATAKWSGTGVSPEMCVTSRNHDGTVARTQWKPIARGPIDFFVPGQEFQLQIRASKGFALDKIEINWRRGGCRFGSR